MPSVFTIYNCGTAFHRRSPDVVARLWALNNPQADCHINDGPGSGTLKPVFMGGRKSPGGKKVAGMLFGGGVDANVMETIEVLRQMPVLPRTVNMVGWSRGAVTCTKISNLMFRMGGKMAAIKVNIFAIDPVPGTTPMGGDMWRLISLTPNVAYYNTVFAQHDLRGHDNYFEPVYPTNYGLTDVDIDIMPGSHSSIVVFKGKRPEDNAELVYDLSKRFLMSHGTRFTDNTLMTANDILTRYGLIQQNYDVYTTLDGKALRNMAETVRVMKNSDKQTMGGMTGLRPRFFINAHHREVFRTQYPYLTNEIERDPPQTPFGPQWAQQWGRELDRVMAECVEQAKAVLAFSMRCRRE